MVKEEIRIRIDWSGRNKEKCQKSVRGLLVSHAEPRKHTILPRNHDNFSEASYFFSGEFYTLWSFSPRIGGTYHFRSSFFHTFVFNLWKNQAEYSISVVKYQIFLLFIKIFLGTRFLGSSENLDSGCS